MTGLPLVVVDLFATSVAVFGCWLVRLLWLEERAWHRRKARRAARELQAHAAAVHAYSPGRATIFAPIGVVARARRDEAPTRWPLLVWPTGEYPAVAAPVLAYGEPRP